MKIGIGDARIGILGRNDRDSTFWDWSLITGRGATKRVGVGGGGGGRLKFPPFKSGRGGDLDVYQHIKWNQ